MYYYKTAETTAGTKDYFNQGYSKMRIASLYESQHSQNDSNITRLKVAIHCFRHIGDTTFLISCYGMLGSLSGMKYPDSTERYLNRAIELAQRFDPPRQYTYKSKLAGLFFYHYMDYPRAKALAMDVMRNGSKDCLEYQFYYYATISFLKTGQLDSAKYVLSRFPAPIDAVDSMNWFDAMAEVAQAEGNLVDYGKYAVKSRELTSQILARSQEKQIVETEKEYSKQQILNNGLTARRHSHILAIVLIVVLYRLLRNKMIKFKPFRKIDNIIQGGLDGLKSIFHLSPRSMVLFILHSILIYLFYIAGGVVILQAFPETADLGFGAAFVLYLFGSIGMTISQGGLGAYPALVMEALALYGIGQTVGLAAGWLLWASQQAIVIVVGLAYLVYFSLVKKKAKVQPSTQETNNM
jgi:hypothetical protein